MSAAARANSAPGSWRPEPDARVVELNVPAESSRGPPPIVNNHGLPDELVVSLTSTVSSRSTPGHAAHRRHCKVSILPPLVQQETALCLRGSPTRMLCTQGCGLRRPDAVWHHQLGRKKYKFFLEQPTSLTGAGRDISFLCDAMVTQRKRSPLPPLTDRSGIGEPQNVNVSERLIPEEYHVVKNKGLRSLQFFEDAFTVQLQDDEQKLRVFPSLNDQPTLDTRLAPLAASSLLKGVTIGETSTPKLPAQGRSHPGAVCVLRVSRRPSGRLEVIQLMRRMDDMLEKAGVDRQMEELTELSQVGGRTDESHVGLWG
ncbi:Axonemal dynein light chain domain-containing protein 1 [Liparis tanakae]|uniref:Axonemal dynein light chain domain-containing protein 1 n=1 Tax=Liparis tanakae TaxID=230148 RepID=A0A4Z2ETT1_9TELE|nr:Axonemal dynein light chain domain-containing protein 1 [Liparis tanakae]